MFHALIFFFIFFIQVNVTPNDYNLLTERFFCASGPRTKLFKRFFLLFYYNTILTLTYGR